MRAKQSPLAELPIQYADFALWQREWLQGEALDAAADYWRAQLAERRRCWNCRAKTTSGGADAIAERISPFELPAELTALLQALSRSEGATLFMTLLAAFDVLLCRYSGTEQISWSARRSRTAIGWRRKR